MKQDAETAVTEPADSTAGGGLRDRSFLGLLVAQFLGTANDNIFRWLAVDIGKELVGPEHAATAVSAGLAVLVVPFLIFASTAGWLADRYSKRAVIVACKGLEIVVMLLGVAAILQNNVYSLFIVLFMMGAQSALFTPSKYGSLPELVREDRIPAANACMGLTTVVAIVVGSITGHQLYGMTKPLGLQQWWISAAVIVGVAIVGFLASLMMRPLKPANPTRRYEWNIVAQTIRDLYTLGHTAALLRVALGSAFFWTLASVSSLTVDAFGIQVLQMKQEEIGTLLGILSVGVAAGNVLAGIWSRGRVELGLVPLASIAMAVSSMSLMIVDGFAMSCVCLFFLGCSAGMFDVPLASYLQHCSPPQLRGAVLAASNFLTFSGMLVASGLFALAQMPVGPNLEPLLTPQGIFFIAGMLTLFVAVYAFTLLPQATVRLIVWIISSTIYRVKVVGLDNLPETGGAILAPNHVSWVDGLLLAMTSTRPLRMVLYADYFENRWLRPLAKMSGAIPIKPGSRRSVIEAIRTAREALNNGELVCIFPEGALTRTGQLLAFQPGFLAFLKDTTAPVVPVYLGGLWGSIFSFSRGRYIWKWPRQWPYHVQIVIGKPMENVKQVEPVRHQVMELGAVAMDVAKSNTMLLPRKFIRNCRRNLRRDKVVDTTGIRLTGASLLLRTLIVRRLLLKHVLKADEKFVGVLLPPSGPAVIANAALPLCGRVAVNLNYTVSSAVMNHCIRDAGIKHVLTSRKVIHKLGLELDAELIYLEDLRELPTKADKAIAALQAFATPAWLLDKVLGIDKIKPDDLMTIIFTSGSTGEPKGVMLTHYNIASNVQAVDDVVHIKSEDTLLGILPFFHSLGYTVTIWTVLSLDLKGAYHFSPLEAQTVGELCRKEKGTLLLCTPTFLRSYLKRIPTEDFKTLNVVVAGAEKLPPDLCEAFEQKFGVRPVEGYGTTECSPLVSVNIPASRAVQTDFEVVVAREGTVGRPVPGVAARVVDPETKQERGANEDGMLLIKGPNVMPGYLNKPDKTAEVLHDGWYTTGDIAQIDSDGFIKITGRLSRFSKIGGEMVPHIRIEELLQKVIGAGEDEVRAAVTAVPDARKGERLVVVHVKLDQSPQDITRKLAEEGLPNIWIPGSDSFIEVEEIPHLVTGKLDLKRLKDLALERVK